MWFAKWLSNQNTFVESRRKLFSRTWWTRHFVNLSTGLFKYKITNKTYSKNKNQKCNFNFTWSNESSRYQLSKAEFYFRWLEKRFIQIGKASSVSEPLLAVGSETGIKIFRVIRSQLSCLSISRIMNTTAKERIDFIFPKIGHFCPNYEKFKNFSFLTSIRHL